ncbi:MAG: ATP-binding cassette domain-containing protein [Chromatiaceae bacterium]|nr:MAG: ATP-binding cassette domain-containing protein [Chromatiaceae bacterium]
MARLHLQGLLPLLGSGLRWPVDLDIGAGELVFLSGPSGSGKSLLLRAIADLDPSAGEILIDDSPRSDLRARQWRQRVALLPAESGWWAERVGAHFPVPPPGAAGADADPPVHPDLKALLSRLGFSTDVYGWSVARLSTGERHRLALARLLAHTPGVLLLDEATANLDPTNRARVEAVVDDYRERFRAAVLWVSHDAEQRERLRGRHLVIADGALREAEGEMDASTLADLTAADLGGDPGRGQRWI